MTLHILQHSLYTFNQIKQRMGRNPCCEKMGLKKGPWSTEEDLILTNYIQQYGHDNWRALPKRAGLLRCGKSCRLRWMNYLRPDIKRGNFTRDEEETIVKLHQDLGNRWSVIASKLPGRTDNEIKNIWNTSLKKRINKPENEIHIKKNDLVQNDDNSWNSNSPINSSSDISSVDIGLPNLVNDSMYKLPEIDESFWSDNLSTEINESQFSIDTNNFSSDLSFTSGIDFWSGILSNEQELIEWPEFW